MYASYADREREKIEIGIRKRKDKDSGFERESTREGKLYLKRSFSEVFNKNREKEKKT